MDLIIDLNKMINILYDILVSFDEEFKYVENLTGRNLRIFLSIYNENNVRVNKHINNIIEICDYLQERNLKIVKVDDILFNINNLSKNMYNIENLISTFDIKSEEQKEKFVNLINKEINIINSVIINSYIDICININEYIFNEINNFDILLKEKRIEEIKKKKYIYNEVILKVRYDLFLEIIKELKSEKKE